MARYFFNVRDNENYEEDVVGAEFSSAAVAIGEANLAAREMVAAKVLAGEVIDGQVFEITDEHGAIIKRVSLRSVLRLD